MNWDRWPSLKQSVPMRIEAHMAEPIVYYGDGLHIDGVIAYAVFRDFPERTRRRIPNIQTVKWAQDFRLPLVRVSVSEDDPLGWVWAASAVHAVWLAHTSVSVRKRPAVINHIVYSKDRKINTTQGTMKAWDLTFPAVITRRLVWWARGDIEEVRRLLTTYVHYLGKKTSLGNGKVLKWAVEADEKDRSIQWADCLCRRMPRSFRPDLPASRGPIRPPYYHPSRVTSCVEPVYHELLPDEQ